MIVFARNASIALSLLVTVLAPPGRAAPPDQAGVATAVNSTAFSLPPGGTESVLDVGAAVVQRERIATDTEGQAQLLMLDGSSFTIGPGASVVLDEFYFDPATGTGRAGLSLAKGMLRFVGGKLSKSQAVTIETPNGTVGIRGGIAVVEVDETTKSTRATFLYGNAMTVTGKRGGIETVTRPGYAISVVRNAMPLKPERVSQAQVVQITKSLSGTVARPVPETKLAKQQAVAPLPSKPATPATKAAPSKPPAPATMASPPRPAPQPIHPRLPLQARPKPPAKPPVKPPPKRAEGPTPPDPCDNARQVCG